ncbi:MAG: hypothetical protein WDN03_01370 [Rhizomicrobium sp.]
MADLINTGDPLRGEAEKSRLDAGVATVKEASIGAAAGAVSGTIGASILGVTSVAGAAAIPLVGGLIGAFLAAAAFGAAPKNPR